MTTLGTAALGTPAERVRAGAAWLDERWPSWLNAIDLGALEMANCEACVLGQVFGDSGLVVTPDGKASASALTHIGLTFAEADACGFSAFSEELIGEEDFWDLPDEQQQAMQDKAVDEYAELAGAWRELIRRRLDGGVS